jgi:hypothetical protein
VPWKPEIAGLEPVTEGNDKRRRSADARRPSAVVGSNTNRGGHGGKSTALLAFLELMGIHNPPPIAAAPGDHAAGPATTPVFDAIEDDGTPKVIIKGASAGMLARAQAEEARRARTGEGTREGPQSFAKQREEGMSNKQRRALIEEARQRILGMTINFATSVKEREEEEARRRAKREEATRKGVEWHEMSNDEYVIATGQGQRASIKVQVYTTTKPKDPRDRKLGTRDGRLSSQKKFALKKNKKKATAAEGFSFLDMLRTFGSTKAHHRAILASTWIFLEEAEREFAAALLIQSWARRCIIYTEGPPPYLCRLSVTSLADALAIASRAVVSTVNGKVVFEVAAPTVEELTEAAVGAFRQNVDERDAEVEEAEESDDDDDDAPFVPPEPEAAPFSPPMTEVPTLKLEASPVASPRSLLEASVSGALKVLAGDAAHFADERSGFAYSKNYQIGPCGTCNDDGAGGDEAPDPDEDEEPDADMLEKMSKDWLLMMHCAREKLPAPFNELEGLMRDAGWRRPAALWQRVVRDLYNSEVLTVSQKSDGDIFEIWF